MEKLNNITMTKRSSDHDRTLHFYFLTGEEVIYTALVEFNFLLKVKVKNNIYSFYF